MGRVIHFEIPSNNIKKSKSFYQKVFKWKFEKWGKEDFWIIKTGEESEKGIDGDLIQKNDIQQSVVNTINVKNIDKTIKKIIKNGGQILMDKSPIKGVGWLVYFKDLDQNMFGVMENDKKAK